MSWTEVLYDDILCSCGTRGSHPESPRCPQEGSTVHVYDVDTTVLRYRYEDDPVVMAVLDALEGATTAYAQLRVVYEFKSRRYEDEVHTIRAARDKHRDKWEAKDHDLALEREKVARLDRTVASLRAEVKKMEEERVRFRAVIEEVAIRSGQFIDEGTHIHGWKDQTLLREFTIRTLMDEGTTSG